MHQPMQPSPRKILIGKDWSPDSIRTPVLTTANCSPSASGLATQLNISNHEKDCHRLSCLMYSFGVMPATFLKERKKEARELKPHTSANASKVYLAYCSHGVFQRFLYPAALFRAYLRGFILFFFLFRFFFLFVGK